jgi:hypothetical protein
MIIIPIILLPFISIFNCLVEAESVIRSVYPTSWIPGQRHRRLMRVLSISLCLHKKIYINNKQHGTKDWTTLVR